jgi:hypothetical protein
MEVTLVVVGDRGGGDCSPAGSLVTLVVVALLLTCTHTHTLSLSLTSPFHFCHFLPFVFKVEWEDLDDEEQEERVHG